jgi:hypothetical protein
MLLHWIDEVYPFNVPERVARRKEAYERDKCCEFIHLEKS